MTTKSTKFEMIPVFHETHCIYMKLYLWKWSHSIIHLQLTLTCQTCKQLYKNQFNHSMKSFPVWKRRCWDSVYSRGRAGVSQVWWHNGFDIVCGSINTLDKHNGLIFSCYLVVSQSFANRSWLLVVDKGITSQFDVCINWGLYLGMGDLKLQLHNSKKKCLQILGIYGSVGKRSGGTWRPLTIASFQTFQPAASC